MSDIEVFELDDDFDPLADTGITSDEEVDEEAYDYLPPIPDADRSVVPEPAELTADEKMDKLLAGIPGQKFRILRVVALCAEPRTIGQVKEALDAEFPQDLSVYDACRLVQLLERAGGLEALPSETAIESVDNDMPDDAEYLTVEQDGPARYVATTCGKGFVKANMGVSAVASMLAEEPRYTPIYERIMHLAGNEGGCSVGDISAAVDDDPLCQSPRRMNGYFLNRLENVDAVRWQGTWLLTEAGREALASDIFAA